MKAIKRTVVLAVSALLGTNGLSANATPAKTSAGECSPKQFVQSFYDWYVFKKGKESDVRGTELVLKEKKQLFSPSLYNALSDDLKASAKSKDEVVGLDFDPFINTQEAPQEKYEAGTATSKGTTYRVPVYGINGGKKPNAPTVEAEITTTNGRCVFSNFHYGKMESPENQNLVGVLAALRKERAHSRK